MKSDVIKSSFGSQYSIYMKKGYQNKKKSSFSSFDIFGESAKQSIEEENEESPKFKADE